MKKSSAMCFVVASFMATHAPSEGGDPVRAVTVAERACALTTNSALHLDTLAAAYASAGCFDDAIPIVQKALDLLARADNQPQAVQEIAARFELYRSGHAYRHSMGAKPPQNQ